MILIALLQGRGSLERVDEVIYLEYIYFFPLPDMKLKSGYIAERHINVV